MTCHARLSRASSAALALVAGLTLAACGSTEAARAEYREAWHSGDVAGALASIDTQLADSSGLDVEEVEGSNGLASAIDPDEGDICLYLLERGMVSLLQGDLQSSIDLFIRGRDGLDSRLNTDFSSYFTDIAASLAGETATDYSGADYEHLLVRSLLSLTDLMAGDGQAEAYAFQFIEKQEQILGLAYDLEGVDYEPRQQYERVAFGHYLRGVLDEREGGTDAANIYALASQYSGGESELIEASLQRVNSSEPWAASGNGVLHVFALMGRGPYLQEKQADADTELAVRLATIALAILRKSATPAIQDTVPVPSVVRTDVSVAPVRVSLGEEGWTTESILDLNAVAEQQLEANRPLNTARAVVRRTLIGLAADKASEESIGLSSFAGIGFNLGATLREKADTRSWATLPAEIHAARIELPAGVHELNIGGVMRRVEVSAGRDSFALLVRPTPGGGSLYLDPSSIAAELVPDSAE